jgi:hypothetical protein
MCLRNSRKPAWPAYDVKHSEWQKIEQDFPASRRGRPQIPIRLQRPQLRQAQKARRARLSLNLVFQDLGQGWVGRRWVAAVAPVFDTRRKKLMELGHDGLFSYGGRYAPIIRVGRATP